MKVKRSRPVQFGPGIGGAWSWEPGGYVKGFSGEGYLCRCSGKPKWGKPCPTCSR